MKSKDNLVECFFYNNMICVPIECAQDLSAQGSVDDSANYWANKIDLSNIPLEDKIQGLLECGAWEESELRELDEHELDMKILFVSIPDGYRR